MFNCKQKDELLELIKSKGFSPVLTPRDNIQPLDLIVRNDKGIIAWIKDLFSDQPLTHTGDKLQDVIIGDAALEIKESELTSEISGTKSSKVEIETGVELAMFFLNAQDNGVSDEDRKAALKTALAQMDKVSFTIDGHTIKRGVSWASIDSYLTGATIREDLSTLKDMILGNQVYIITHVLSSNSFAFNEEGTSSASLEAQLPKIKAMLEGNFKGGISMGESSGIKYKGEKQMVFGVQAVQLFAKEENGKTSFRIKSKEVGVKGSENSKDLDEFPVKEIYLEDDENFLFFK